MSSHREAPGTSKDPVADNTDTYAFVSPDRPDTVTLISNYIPLEEPPGGPTFFEFGDDVLYEIHIDHNGDGKAEITYQFRFTTLTRNPNSFLYNTGQITSISSPNFNRPQFYSVTRVDEHGHSTLLGNHLASPPCNVGIRSTPNYEALAEMAVHTLSSGEVVFAGQRAEGFYVDLGAVFDLLALRPFQNLHLIPTPATQGVDNTKGLNVHTIAIQIPKKLLTQDGSNPTDPNDPRSVIGVYASASRRKAIVFEGNGDVAETGPWVQVSRLAEPLINEVIIPLGKKDYWNSQDPKNDKQFVQYYAHPEVSRLLPVLYPGVFPHLAAYTKPRVDLEAILLTGIPSGIIKGFQNFTGPTPADLIRLNMAIPPAAKPNILGVIGGDLAGFPNGRRVFDDTTTVELRALAGLTIPLVDPTFKPDAAAGLIDQFNPPQIPDGVRYKQEFPYLGVPFGGYQSIPHPVEA
ncbi:MAG: DUF4331 domain-containing protein [Ktedonobacteraceae bacterium]